MQVRPVSFTLAGQRLACTRYGDVPRLVVLLHGLLFSHRVHDELARALAQCWALPPRP